MWLGCNIAFFLLFQVIASIFFKWGTFPGKYWWGFALGNLFGMSSIIMLINVYKVLSPSATLAICTGGAFVLNQVGLMLVFKQSIPLPGWIGIFLILAGITIFALTSRTSV